MANSPTHKFGQIIGDLIERTIIEFIEPIAKKHDVYIDYRHPRNARGGKNEVIWIDINGNSHKLDIVLERNGSEDVFGHPTAFIEIAWRRYTKHSKNKVQEIQGAIMPLLARYNINAPFFGCVLAGEFTPSSITQLQSLGFNVVYFNYESIIQAFSKVGINARWEETTDDVLIEEQILRFEQLSSTQISCIISNLLCTHIQSLSNFGDQLILALTRRIESIKIYSLHGITQELGSLREAFNYICSYSEGNCSAPLVKYEITIRYTNGDRIEVEYCDKQSVLGFLMTLMNS